ncbi:MAG: hypothetical protein ACRDT0_22815 [Pseudonocardiaceae bacterium]
MDRHLLTEANPGCDDVGGGTAFPLCRKKTAMAHRKRLLGLGMVLLRVPH